jgi:hypothetical protein
MEIHPLALLALVVADIPLFVLLFRLIFRGSERTHGEAAGRLPHLGELFDPEFLKDKGGENKLLLLLFAAALLVLVEYLVVLRVFPGLSGLGLLHGTK